MTYALRPYTPADEDATIALWHRTWQIAYPDIDFNARLSWWRTRWRTTLVPIAAIVVAENADGIAGFVTIDQASGYLDQLVVAPDVWGSPVGALLLDEAKRLSPAGVTLKVNADNIRAIAFYSKHGFVRTGVQTNPDSGRAVDCMEWRPGLGDNTAEEWTNLRRRWFGSVYEIADLEYQRRTWLSPPTESPHWSYVEFCCKYPDADQLLFAKDRGHLSAREFELLATLDQALVSYRAADQYDHRAILGDPDWHAVVVKAEEIRQQLLTLTADAIERRYLMGQ